MVVITSQEIALFRSKLAAYPEALKALDEMEDCEVNIEDSSTRLRRFRVAANSIRRESQPPAISSTILPVTEPVSNNSWAA